MAIDVSDFDSFEAPQPKPQKMDVSDFDKFEAPVKQPQKQAKPERSWIDTAADFGKGLYLGALESAGGLAQKAANLGLAPGGKLIGEQVQRLMTPAQEAYKGTGMAGIPGRIAGNIAGTAPLGPALKGIGMLPGLAKGLAGRFGAAAGAGAAQGALAGGTAYSDDPESTFNLEGAAMGAAGGALLNPLTQVLPIMRTRMRNDELVKSAYEKIIGKISKKIANTDNSYQSEKIAGRVVKTMAMKVKAQEKQAWDSLFKGMSKTPMGSDISNTTKGTVKGLVDQYGYQMPTSMKTWLNKNITSKGDFTFGKLKDIRSGFRNNVKDALWKKKAQGEPVHDAAMKANEVYDELTFSLRSSAQRAGKEADFIKANTFSKEANMFNSEFGTELKQLAVHRTAVGKFVNKFFSEKSGTATAGRLAQIPGGTQKALTSNSMKQLALKHTDMDGSFNIKGFFNEVSRDPRQLGMLEGNPQFKALTGLMDVIQDAGQAGALNLGAASRFGSFTSLGNNMLNHLTSARSAGLRKSLVQYGLIKRNQKLKQYLGNRITEKLLRIGAVQGNSYTLKDERNGKKEGTYNSSSPNHKAAY